MNHRLAQKHVPDTPLLQYTVQGTGPTVVLLHGVAGSSRIWDRVVPYLIDSYTVVRIDLLGYGHSPKPHIRYTPKVHVTAIHNTLRAHGITTPFTIIGLSMGVDIALEYTARWPGDVNGFVGIGFPYYANEIDARHNLHNDFWTRLTLETPWLARLITPPIWWMGRVGILPVKKFAPIYSKVMAKDALRNKHYAFESTLLECMVHNRLDPLLETSKNMRRLFIHGADDTWATVAAVQRVVQKYPKSYLVVLPDTEHNAVVVNASATAKEIRKYLESN